MKKCRRCSKPATLHITEIRKGEVQQLHLCESCAQKYLQADPEADTEAMPGLPDADPLETADELACPHCGITFRQFRAQGRLGCPHDYEVFASELQQLLENIHDGTQHLGKVPSAAGPANQEQFRLIKLRSELQSAIKEEAYEKAAKLRDQIQEMEARLSVESPASL